MVVDDDDDGCTEKTEILEQLSEDELMDEITDNNEKSRVINK
jgi:hypothetical protein